VQIKAKSYIIIIDLPQPQRKRAPYACVYKLLVNGFIVKTFDLSLASVNDPVYFETDGFEVQNGAKPVISQELACVDAPFPQVKGGPVTVIPDYTPPTVPMTKPKSSRSVPGSRGLPAGGSTRVPPTPAGTGVNIVSSVGVGLGGAASVGVVSASVAPQTRVVGVSGASAVVFPGVSAAPVATPCPVSRLRYGIGPVKMLISFIGSTDCTFQPALPVGQSPYLRRGGKYPEVCFCSRPLCHLLRELRRQMRVHRQLSRHRL